MINRFLVITLFLITGCSGGESEVKKLSFQQCKDKTIEQVFNKTLLNINGLLSLKIKKILFSMKV